MEPKETGRGNQTLVKQIIIFVVVFAISFFVTRYLFKH